MKEIDYIIPRNMLSSLETKTQYYFYYGIGTVNTLLENNFIVLLGKFYATRWVQDWKKLR